MSRFDSYFSSSSTGGGEGLAGLHVHIVGEVAAFDNDSFEAKSLRDGECCCVCSEGA